MPLVLVQEPAGAEEQLEQRPAQGLANGSAAWALGQQLEHSEEPLQEALVPAVQWQD